ncbi:ferric reductase-like transmembrane domain-containing protein [Actinoplanes sp. Pm04-4]|uniref:Ferric reductase-like transmembrane domain-containing protein n=1 Tax=Paractinoplanes pyxinae TaxID=2997416 RepID=A0ABT4B0D2_9ACTN|nr:ferric reductase-like transmembrane domain-containing protein [Actinoplanes pyxinae]MCY1139952.1 ferric reductase-like transmembrane domain-containing protein [Actinoplanes pyxinae]
MTDALWYFARGSGVMSLVLLTIVVALGIGARSGRTAFGLPAFAVNLVHRNAALLAVVLLAGHMLSLLFDPYAQLRVFDLVLPFAGNYRPLWQGLGTLAFDLIAAIVVTSLLRHRLGVRTWRIVHWLAYLSWPIALMHGLGTGSDNGTVWLWTIAALCTATVLAAVAWRLTPTFGRFPQRAMRRINPRLLPDQPTPATTSTSTHGEPRRDPASTPVTAPARAAAAWPGGAKAVRPRASDRPSPLERPVAPARPGTHEEAR